MSSHFGKVPLGALQILYPLGRVEDVVDPHILQVHGVDTEIVCACAVRRHRCVHAVSHRASHHGLFVDLVTACNGHSRSSSIASRLPAALHLMVPRSAKKVRRTPYVHRTCVLSASISLQRFRGSNLQRWHGYRLPSMLQSVNSSQGKCSTARMQIGVLQAQQHTRCS